MRCEGWRSVVVVVVGGGVRTLKYRPILVLPKNALCTVFIICNRRWKNNKLFGKLYLQVYMYETEGSKCNRYRIAVTVIVWNASFYVFLCFTLS